MAVIRPYYIILAEDNNSFPMYGNREDAILRAEGLASLGTQKILVFKLEGTATPDTVTTVTWQGAG